MTIESDEEEDVQVTESNLAETPSKLLEVQSDNDVA